NAARSARQYSYLHTRTRRIAVTVRPAASRTVARNTCLPFFAFVAFQSTNASPLTSAFSEPSFFASAAKTTFFRFLFEPAMTTSRVVVRRHSFLPGRSHVTVGLPTTATFVERNVVFGMTFAPIVLTFFVSW